ncbi:MAG: RNA polymerase sigma factor [Gemmatimonadota bacterium]|nr:MAG: RNA polymerase sigma factor [Gemmatimonadota bacterium]
MRVPTALALWRWPSAAAIDWNGPILPLHTRLLAGLSRAANVSGGVMESTASLLHLIRGGDTAARERLARRLLPMLQRWASGRLPASARDLVDTNDVVQITLMRTLENIDHFESRHEGALLVYVRRALLNQIRDQARRGARRPDQGPAPEDLAAPELSPLENAIQGQMLDRYEAALETLPESQREAIVLRLEMGYSHAQVAEAVGVSSPDAARMLVSRGLVSLADRMDEEGTS